jgi:hypothetical protein
MPRPKVTDRKRAEKACTSCKRRKEKCDGIQPCGRCKHRNRETECSFPGDIRSTNIRNASTGAIYSHLDSFECDGSSVTNEPRHDILRRNVPNGDTASLNAATSAPVQELPVKTPQNTYSPLSLALQRSSISSTPEISGLDPLLGLLKEAIH